MRRLALALLSGVAGCFSVGVGEGALAHTAGPALDETSVQLGLGMATPPEGGQPSRGGASASIDLGFGERLDEAGATRRIGGLLELWRVRARPGAALSPGWLAGGSLEYLKLTGLAPQIGIEAHGGGVVWIRYSDASRPTVSTLVAIEAYTGILGTPATVETAEPWFEAGVVFGVRLRAIFLLDTGWVWPSSR